MGDDGRGPEERAAGGLARPEAKPLIPNLAERASTTIATAAKEVAKPALEQLLPALAAVATMTAAVPVVGLVVALSVAYRADRFSRFWREYRRRAAAGQSPAEVYARVARKAVSDRRYADALFDTLRKLVDAPDSSTVPALSQLLADYEHAGDAPDAFFRGMVRLLTTVSAEELADLRQLVCFAATHDPPGARFELHANGYNADEIAMAPKPPDPPPGQDPRRLFVRAEPEYSEGKRRLEGLHHIARLFRLLKANDLGEDGTGGFPGALTGPLVMAVRQETMIRMQRIVEQRADCGEG
jgi:hypothetical protein